MPPAQALPVQADPALGTAPAESWWSPGRFALLLASFIAASFPAILFGIRTFIIRDFGLFGYPLAYFHRQCFWQGELPLWDPLSNCGIPFLAQWNTLTLYPLSLIYLLLPLTWSLPFFCLAHMFWGGLGMYFLARRWTQHGLAAAFAGLVFAFNGLTLNSLMWPNVVATLGWMPWVLWLGQRAWLEGGRVFVWAVLAGAMQMLAGGPEAILLTWATLFALACADCLHHRERRVSIPLRFSAMACLVAVVCAAQLLPFLDLLAHSQRDRSFSAVAHDWSMPLWGLANFLVPLFRTTPTAQGVYFQNGQYWTSSYYTGIGALLLGAVAMRYTKGRWIWLWAGLCLLGLALAQGEHGLLYRAARACVPGIGFLRYPIKFVILVLAIAPLLAAYGLKALSSNIRAGRFVSGCAVLLLSLIVAIVACDWNDAVPQDARTATLHNAIVRAGAFALFCGCCALFVFSTGRLRLLASGLLLAVTWLDFVTHVPNQNPGALPAIYTPGWALSQTNWNPVPKLGESRCLLRPATLEALRFHPRPSPEETFLQNRLAARANCNFLDDIPQIDGFFALTPREIAYASQIPYAQPDREFPALLDFLGVSQATAPGGSLDWVARPTAMPLVTVGQQPTFTNDTAAMAALSATNLDLRRVVYLPAEARDSITAMRQTNAQASVLHFANQRIELKTEAPAPSVVVLAQSWYPAWKAFVDGQPVKLWRANYAFQALEVPAGVHMVELRYQDRALRFGAVLSVLGLLACLVLWFRGRAQPGGR